MSDLSGDIEPVCAWYAALGAALGEQASPPAPAAAGSELPPGVLEGLREAAVIGDRARIVAAVVVGCGWEHLDLVRSLENQIAGAAARLTPVGGEALSGIDPLVP
jgi:hypothetical protein